MSNSVEKLIVMIKRDVNEFLDMIKGKPFPSEIKTEEAKMFSFSTTCTGTEFKISVTALKTEFPGKFLIYINTAFMSEPKTKESIIIHGVPLHGTYESTHALENIEEEDQLDSEIYRLIEESLEQHISHAL